MNYLTITRDVVRRGSYQLRIFATLLFLSLALSSTAIASTTWYVNGVNGNDDNDCKSPTTACKTIGHAISLASSGDTISVAAATYTESLTIDFSLKVVGAGAATTIIDGGGGSVVTIPIPTTSVVLSRLTIQNGLAVLGGGINNSGTLTINNATVSGNATSSIFASGGGIYNSGTLTMNNSTVSGNTAGAGGGGGIYNRGTVTISRSTISGNDVKATGNALGGGIYNKGTLTLNNSTLSGNSAIGLRGPVCFSLAEGGGIYVQSGTLTQVNNSTLSGNSAVNCDGVGSGGGIWGNGTLQNTIVANSTNGGNCDFIITSNGFNLSSDNTCNFNNTGDLNNTDPKLGPLQNNGGQTQTQALLSGSPAIDAGNPSGCTDGSGHLLKTDQRGAPRPDKEDSSGCDMGAYERQSD